MQALLHKIRQIIKDRKIRKLFTRAVSLLAAIIVFITTYILVLPAITLEKTASCGIEEHQHTDSCYEKVLICGKEESEGHHHDDSCYTVTKELDCQLEEHQHSAENGCYDEEGNLICQLAEHAHGDSCYKEVKTLTCGLEESEGHHHSEACYEKVLVCGKEAHTHSEACYADSGKTDSGKEESGKAEDSNGKAEGGSSSEAKPQGSAPGNSSAEDAAGNSSAETVPAGNDAAIENAADSATEAAAGEAVPGNYVPELEPLNMEAVFGNNTGFYYFHVGEGQEVPSSSSDITDWKKVKEDTELAPTDLVKMYLPYSIPAGSLNETNPTARYRLPGNIHLTDSQIKAINKNENGITAGYSHSDAKYKKYLGAEAIEGSRTPDELPGSGGQEYISAVVRAENVYKNDKYIGQDLIFTFVPYTIEKNQKTYDAEKNPVSAGKKITGWFACDFRLEQIDWIEAEPQEGITEETQEKTADILFVSEDKDEGIHKIKRTLKVVEKKKEDFTEGETGENTENSEEETGEKPGEKTEEIIEEETKEKTGEEAQEETPDYQSGTLTADGDGYKITLDYTEEAKIPENAYLSVREITAETDKEAYEACLEQAGQQVAADEKTSVDQKASRFFDIEILVTEKDSEGAEKTVKIEPAAPVSVNIRIDEKPASQGSRSDQSDPTVLHFAEEGVEQIDSTVTDSQSKSAEEQNTEIQFEAEAFSVYGVVYTVDFHWEVDGKTYEFSIPGGGFVSFYNLVEALGIEKNDPDTEQDEVQELVDGVESITFSAPELLSVCRIEENTTVGAVKERLGLECEYSAEMTEEEIAEINAQETRAGDWALISMRPFESEETLTVTMKNGEEFAVNVTDAQQIKKVITASGETLQVTVEVHDEKDIDRFADLRVEELSRGTDAYEEAYNAVVSLKDAEDENFDRDKCGFLAADIELLDQDGAAFEPDGTVYVKIELLRLPAEEDVLTSTMEIQHLAKENGRIDVETVASGDRIKKVEGVITARFPVGSFSTFTLTWADDGSASVISDQDALTKLNIQNDSGETYASVNVHFIDTEGNNIRSPFTAAVNGTTPVTIDGLLNSEIEGFEYRGAYYGPYSGEETDQAIASIAASRTGSESTGTEIVSIGNATYGRINNSSARPAGYTAFYSNANGSTPIYWISSGAGSLNNRFHTRTSNLDYTTLYNGTVYGERTATVTNYSYQLSFDNEAIEPLTSTNTTGTWENAADIYLVYEDKDPNMSHATIHYGVVESDGSFTELQESVTLDSSAASLSLNTTISGNEFVAAYYSEGPTQTPASGTQQISPVLRKVDDVWKYTRVDNSETAGVADNSHIYVSYKEKITHNPSTPGDGDIPAPSTVKKVTSNQDGTYDVQLDIIGQQIIETNRKGANVLLIFDRTSSMTNTMSGAPGNGQRVDAAKQAVHTLVDALNPSVNPVELAVFSFARFADEPFSSGGSNWTTNGTAITDFTDALSLAASGSGGGLNGGTNWEAAMEKAAEVLETADDDPTYVIFLTDGNPTIHQGNCNQNGGINSNPNENSDVYTRARTAANNLDPKYKLYGVLCANQSDGPLLQTLVTYLNNNGHDATHILANDAQTLTSTFNNIAEYIVNQLAAGEVSTNDGITALSSVNAAVSGAAGAFKYFKAYEVTYKDNKYYYFDDSGAEQEITDQSKVKTYNYQDSEGNPKTYLYYERDEWADAPGASYNEATGVTWDLSPIGTLKEGAIYSVRFTIWPSQEAYDLLADLNNGIKVYEAGHDNSITDSEREQIYESGGVYYMKTNTNLDTSYSFGGQSYTDTIQYYQGAMDLETRTISMKKLWPENQLDDYGEGHSLEGIKQQVTLMVTKDGEDYFDVTLDKNNQWLKDDVYISCGLLTVHDGVVDIKEPGHDYTVIEPNIFSYYWDLIADVYRPMVIGYDYEDGTRHEATLLVLDEKMTEADNVNSFEIDGKIYKKQSTSDSILKASNYRRSNLNLKKTVTGRNAPKDALFEYTVRIKDAADQDIWFSAMDGDVYQVLETSSNVTAETKIVPGAQYNPDDGTYTYTDNGKTYTLFAADDGSGGEMYTGFYSVPSDEEFTIKIKDGWNVRFINLLHKSTFSFTEGEMDEGFSFVDIGTDTLYPFSLVDPDTVWNNVDGQTITGTIVEPNNSFMVTYTNKWDSVGVLLEKVGEDRETTISGSVFDLETKGETGVWTKVMTDIKPGGTETVVDPDTGETSTVPLGNPLDLGGLGIGLYRFEETLPPNGYIILTEYTYFEVYKDESTLKVRLTDENGTPLTDQSDQEVTETEVAKLTSEVVEGKTIYKISITNTPGASLPHTGGPGTRLFTILGAILIAGAGLLLRRRRTGTV